MQAYVDRHGLPSLQDGDRDVLDMLDSFCGVRDTLEILRIIKPAITLEPEEIMSTLSDLFISVDAPIEMLQAMDILELGREMIPRGFYGLGPLGIGAPRMTTWFADYLEKNFDASSADWQIFLGRAIFRPNPHILASLLKMGVNITPDLISSQVSNGAFAFIPRLIERTRSNHARLKLASNLPSIPEIMSLRSEQVVDLVAGSS